MVYFIIGIIVAVIAIIFALSNAVPVSVSFLVWEFEASLAIILLIAFLVGVLVALIMLVPTMWRKSRHISKQSKMVDELQKKRELAVAEMAPAPGPETKTEYPDKEDTNGSVEKS
jgi:lipopolysaccharide assembly protein A